jgi:RHS repeat-associated protein
MGDASGDSGRLISLPQGGGALHGIGEKFTPDLHTGTGNFTVPIALPAGRNGFQPVLNLIYSTGNGTGVFGQGWSLGVPGVSRRTAKGVPRYDDTDVFVLSGAEDLVRVAPIGGRTRYRPRTEGLFALIERVFDPAGGHDYWEVRSKDGLISIYGLPGKRGTDDQAAIGKDATSKFAWKLTETRDPFGSRIVYSYASDEGSDGPRHWKQPLLSTIEYGEFNDPANPRFLVSVSLEYEDQPEPFSNYRGGFEVRTTRRCSAITIRTHFDADRRMRQYRFSYRDDATNGVSLLSRLDVIGFRDDDSPTLELPALTFDYTAFNPTNAAKRDLIPIIGPDLPARSLGNPDYALIDLTGDGLPDILEMNGVARYWRNIGGGQLDLPRIMSEAPPLHLADPGVQMLDADGDGRADLMVSAHPVAGYYALGFTGEWESRPRRRYQHRPSFSVEDPEVKLLDLDGDGVTDALRSGARFECFFNDPERGWNRTEPHERKALDEFPDVNFSDPRVRLADMTGSGLQDIVLFHNGLVEYWPNLGNGKWGARISMGGTSPRFADPTYSPGYDPKRILLGDVDGDGLADLVYVADGTVHLWINRAGNGWSQEIVIDGTPRVSDMSAIRLVDMLGNGIGGVLWTGDAGGTVRHHYYFLDLTGGVRPYLLGAMDNHMGALTKVEYAASTRYFLEDQHDRATRWRTHLPFPVQVVARAEVIDAVSGGKLTTEYQYHHGYWDGPEREFRGFGMVEQIDTETFEDYHRSDPPHGNQDFARFDETPEGRRQFSPPTLTRTWFHVGACDETATLELDLSDQYFASDSALLDHKIRIDAFLADLPDVQARRDALRALRGSVLRTELYALDGDADRQDRPYTVTEAAYGLRQEAHEAAPAAGRAPQLVFFPFLAAQRTTQWERGDDPMTQFAFTGDYDEFGQPRRHTAIAMPRRAAKRSPVTGATIGRIDPNETRILATHTRAQFAVTPAGGYMHDRPAQAKLYELSQPPPGPDNSGDDARSTLRKQWGEAQRLDDVFAALQPADVRLIGHKVNHYDGRSFEGAEVGTIDGFGVLTRTEALAFTDHILGDGYTSPDPVTDPRQPEYLRGTVVLPVNAPAISAASLGYQWRGADVQLGYEAGYYVDILRRQFDYQDSNTAPPRGLITAMEDPLRHRYVVAFDQFRFFPTKVTDPAGLGLLAEHDYRQLRPKSIIDPNGNRTEIRYSPLGLPLTQFVRSRDDGQGSQGGDEAKPEVAFSYDFKAFELRGEPIFVRTTRRVHHASEQISDESIDTYEYSDGFGRLVQTRNQAEDVIFGDAIFGDGVVPLAQGDPGDRDPFAGGKNTSETDPNVVVSGWQIYDNKGRPIEKFEPYFDRGWDYKPPTPAQLGERIHLFYDPRGQLIRTVNPDGSEQRVIVGVPGDIVAPQLDSPDSFEPTPWESYRYDANDLASVTGLAAQVPPTHYFTPTSALVDAHGRVICQVVRNGPSPQTDWFVTRSVHDIRGNLLQLTDPLGRPAFTYAYDLLDRSLRVGSIDGGLRTVVLDAGGKLTESRDSRGSLLLRIYDRLNRSKQVWARDTAAGIFTLREQIDYGDEGDFGAAIKANALGKPSRHADEAGVIELVAYDFKDNLLERKRRVIGDAAIASGWAADWSDPAATDALEESEYVTTIRYDALNRAIEVQYPADVAGQRASLVPSYNRAGALEQTALDGAVYIERIAYNARGQRTLVVYGNGMMTRYSYDPNSFRLARLRTEGCSAAALIYRPSGEVLQDFGYTYDLAGNVLTIDERVKSCGIRNSAEGPDRLRRRFDYDPVYRLAQATGRACASTGTPRGLDDDPRCGFLAAGTAMATQDNAPDVVEAYTETYRYDPAGNIAGLRYGSASGSWTRTFGLQSLNNQLHNLIVGSLTHSFDYDANGNLIQQNVDRHLAWDHADRMASFRVQPTNGPASVQARYLYGADGMRVKKWVRSGSSTANDDSTVYIDGLFEYRRWTEAGVAKQSNRLHIMDDRNRVAIARVGDKHVKDAWPNVQYHLADHLGGSHVVIGGADSSANGTVNREEYFPYGETSFGSFALKRYRYCGKERDEENTLCHVGLRYYAPSLGRWISCDPAGLADGSNGYVYVRGNPIRLFDPTGAQSAESTPAGQNRAIPKADAAKPLKWVGDNIIVSKEMEPWIKQWIPIAFNQGEDAKHIHVDKGVLQIDENYAEPSDKFRWRLLKDVIESGEKATIKGMASGGPTYVLNTLDLKPGATIKQLPVTDYIMREPGITLPSKNLFKKVWGDLVSPTVETSQRDPTRRYQKGMTGESENMTFVYFENRFPMDAITHELLGHLYLASTGRPFLHDGLKDTYTAADADKIAVEYKLTAKQQVRDREGKIFEGRVWDFIKQVEGK